MTRKTLLFRLAGVATLIAVWAGLMTVAFAEHGAAKLDVVPETTRVPIGATVHLIATLSERVSTSAERSVEIDAEAEPTNPATQSPNDPDATDGQSLTTPDLTCTIPRGEYRCALTYVPTSTGTDQWRVWVDEDHDNSDSEADEREMRNESSQPGSGLGDDCVSASPSNPTGEPDCTDVVEVIVSNPTTPVSSLDCDDATGPDRERETNGAGETENYSCKLRSEGGGSSTAFGTVYGEVVNGINDPDELESGLDFDDQFNVPDFVCVTATAGTAPEGECTISVPQSENEVGTADICFWSYSEIDPAPASPEPRWGDDEDLCGEEEVDEVASRQIDTGNDMADAVELTWSNATPGPTTGTGVTTSSTTTSSSSTQTTGGMTTPPGQSTTTTTTDEPGVRRLETNLTIDYGRGAFKGKAKSSVARCQKFRLVKLKKKRPGKDRTVGKDTTSRTGVWKIRKRRARGTYYATAARKVFTDQSGTRTVCMGDRSPNKRVR